MLRCSTVVRRPWILTDSIKVFGSSGLGRRFISAEQRLYRSRRQDVRFISAEQRLYRSRRQDVDFSSVHSLTTLEKYLEFRTLSWDSSLLPAFNFPSFVAGKVASMMEKTHSLPVMALIHTLRACETSVSPAELTDINCLRNPPQYVSAYPNQSEVQLELLHEEESEGTEYKPFEAIKRGEPFRFEDLTKSMYMPPGTLHLQLNFPVREGVFRGCVDVALILEHEDGWGGMAPLHERLHSIKYVAACALHERLHSIKYVAACAPSGLKDAPGQENEVYHYKLLAQMSAAIAHNQGGSIWGALCDGNDLWRFYRMTREDHTGREGIHCDEFLFGDFGDLGETDGAGGKESYPYSYHIQISPTLSVKHFDPAADSLKVVDYVLSLTHHDWMGCAENMYPGGRG